MENSRETWDKSKFDYKSQEFEKGIAMNIMIGSEGFLIVNPIGQMRKKHDLQAYVCLKSDGTPMPYEQSKPIRIEVERGTKQDFWGSSLMDCRSHWPYGINILARKCKDDAEGQEFAKSGEWDIFLKANNFGYSFFAVGAQWFTDQKLSVKSINNSLSRDGIRTCNEVASIPWSKITNRAPLLLRKDLETPCCYGDHLVVDDWAQLVLLIKCLWVQKNGGKINFIR